LREARIDDRAHRRQVEGRIRADAKLVFSTLFSSLRETHYFDCCIIDEACQASELECFMGVVKGRKFILSGDPHQLCPEGYSFYENARVPQIVLKEQYRMHGDLIEFSNGHFYNNEILSPKSQRFLFFDLSSILLIDTSYFDFAEESSGVSKINRKEAVVIADVIKWLGATFEGSIGVIVPYSAQALLIGALLEEQDIKGCDVNTVDGFQGQERDFIVLGLVRSNEDKEYGFLSDEKRMNVALTRCRRGLVVVGDVETFRTSDFYRKLFKHFGGRGYVIDPELFGILAASTKNCL